MPRPLASLGLVGDGDELDVIRDLEHAFGVDFGSRPERWTTVGDIEADVLALYPAAEAAGLCASAMAFRQLRAALPKSVRRARPDDALAGLLPCAAARRLNASLRRDGLVVAVNAGGLVASLGLMTLFAGLLLLAPLAATGHGWLATALPVGVVLFAIDRGAPRDATLGEVARETAAMNFACYAARGADRRPAAIWDAINRILANTACVDAGRIGRATRLFD